MEREVKSLVSGHLCGRGGKMKCRKGLDIQISGKMEGWAYGGGREKRRKNPSGQSEESAVGWRCKRKVHAQEVQHTLKRKIRTFRWEIPFLS